MARGETQSIVQQHLPEINQWRAEGIPQREIARRLGIPDSSLRHALKTLPTEVHPRMSEPVSGSDAQIYQGILPTLREVVDSWDTLKEMLADYTQRKRLEGVAPEYQPYDGFYSCRLSHRLIEDIRAYATEHRLSQSELVTVALQAYMKALPS
jgi:hypothetical protein